MGELAAMTPDVLYKLIKVMLYCLEPTDLCRVSCSSKLAGEACRAVVLSSNEAPRLLQLAVKEGSTPPAGPVQMKPSAAAAQHMRASCQSVQWLLSLDSSCARTQAEDLVQIPNVPAELVAALIRAGVRVTQQMLVNAAKQRVAGAEVWAQVQQQLEVVTDIDQVAEVLCCKQQGDMSRDHALEPVRALLAAAATDTEAQQQLDGDLHIAINRQRLTWTAQALVQEAKQLDIPTTTELLLTAAERHHTIIAMLLISKAVQQGYNRGRCDDLLLLLHACVQHKVLHRHILRLLQQPCVADISVAAVVELLEALIRSRTAFHVNALHWLEKLPQVQLIDAAGVYGLLSVALECLSHDTSSLIDVVWCLCKLPSAKQMGSAAFADLIAAAVRVEAPSAMYMFYRFPAAADLVRDAVIGLVRDPLKQNLPFVIEYHRVAGHSAGQVELPPSEWLASV